MDDNAFYQFLKLFMEYFSIWSLLLLGLVVYLYRNPEHLKAIPNYVESFRVGDFEVQLRKIEEKLKETEEHVTELEDENTRLSTLYTEFDPHASLEELETTRQTLKARAGNLDDLSPVLEALKPGAGAAEVYAAAETLRAKRDFSAFDALIDCLDRIASDDRLEGLRYHTVWTLASAVHRTVLAAVKHTDRPLLSPEQLERAKITMQKLHANAHVQDDRPDQPNLGIRGPASYALNWIEKGLKKHQTADNA